MEPVARPLPLTRRGFCNLIGIIRPMGIHLTVMFVGMRRQVYKIKYTTKDCIIGSAVQTLVASHIHVDLNFRNELKTLYKHRVEF